MAYDAGVLKTKLAIDEGGQETKFANDAGGQETELANDKGGQWTKLPDGVECKKTAQRHEKSINKTDYHASP